jgi:hypothetical protein
MMGAKLNRFTAAHETGHFFRLMHSMHEDVHQALRRAYGNATSLPNATLAANLSGETISPASLERLDFDEVSQGSWLAVRDTPPDPGPYYFAFAFQNPVAAYCDPTVEIPISEGGTVKFWTNPDRFSLMNYRIRANSPAPFDLYTPCPRVTMTVEQARNARRTILDTSQYDKLRLLQ